MGDERERAADEAAADERGADGGAEGSGAPGHRGDRAISEWQGENPDGPRIPPPG
jgi:hypothetical protein